MSNSRQRIIKIPVGSHLPPGCTFNRLLLHLPSHIADWVIILVDERQS